MDVSHGDEYADPGSLSHPSRRDGVEFEWAAHRNERYPAYGERPKAGETSGDGVGQGKIRARVDESAEAGAGNLRAGRFRRARRDRPRSDGMELRRIRGADTRGDPRPGARMDDFHRRLSRRGKPRSSQRAGRSA